MIRHSMIGLAVALSLGSTAAYADAMIHDPNTGLERAYYYDTLSNLEARGLPISARAHAYLNEHRGARVAPKHGNVYLLEARPAYGAAYGIDYTSHYGSSDDKQRPW